MTAYPEFTLAAIQAAPVYFDREASTEKACQLILEAGQKGADLAAFSETWLPGYPFFHSSALVGQGRVTYLSNAVEIPSPTTDHLCMTAKKAHIDVAIGVAELDARTRGTVYCTLLFISRDGEILGRHRKLKPSGRERTVWGEGDGVGLRVYERPYGRISGLNCWEHRMLLPGYALMTLGTQIHVATWPFSWHLDPDLNTAPSVSQVFAVQGGCYVIATGALLRPEDVQEPYCDLATGTINEWIGAQKGGCRIIGPGGDVIAQAAVGEETILTASVSLEAVLRAKADIDVGGHYSRPDVLQLHVNRRPLERAIVSDVSAGLDDDQISGNNEHEEKKEGTKNQQLARYAPSESSAGA